MFATLAKKNGKWYKRNIESGQLERREDIIGKEYYHPEDDKIVVEELSILDPTSLCRVHRPKTGKKWTCAIKDVEKHL